MPKMLQLRFTCHRLAVKFPLTGGEYYGWQHGSDCQHGYFTKIIDAFREYIYSCWRRRALK